jgi:uncharacterized caspase-like protein
MQPIIRGKYLPRTKLFYSTLVLLCVLFGLKSQSAADTTLPLPTTDLSQSRYAIIVGINKYRNYPHLNHSVDDAELLAEKFNNLGYTVKLLRDYEADPDIIFDILFQIAELLDATDGQKDGTIVFAFSGHGFQQDGENFLATGKSDPSDLRRSSLAVNELKRVLLKSGIARKLMFIDACRNMPTRSFSTDNNTFLPDTTNEGLGIIYSTAPGELSFEDSELGHGVFSYYLGKALAGVTRSTNEAITLDKVFKYLQTNVSNHVFLRFDKKQYPYIAGERGGDISIGNTSWAAISDTTDAETDATRAGLTTSDTPAPRSFGWKKALTILGTLAIGAVIINQNSSSDNEPDTGISLVIPTP